MSQSAVARPLEALQPLELLFETPGLADLGLPHELSELYGGPLGFSEPRLYANFVASVDGVVAIPTGIEPSHMVAAGSEPDRFVMGLLRACADAVLVGAGTLHDSPRSLWMAEYAYPAAASLYADRRRQREQRPEPTLAPG